MIPSYTPAAVEDGIVGTLTPRMEVDDVPYFAVTPELAGISRKALASRWATCLIAATTSSRRSTFSSRELSW